MHQPAIVAPANLHKLVRSSVLATATLLSYVAASSVHSETDTYEETRHSANEWTILYAPLHAREATVEF